MESLVANAQAINRLLARYGVKFGIYKNNEFIEQLFPFDPVPRVISAEEFEILEQGLKQRVNALNAFLKDIYTDKKIGSSLNCVLEIGDYPEEANLPVMMQV